MTTFLFLLAWASIGFVVFSLIWRYIWLPHFYNNDPNILAPEGVFFGIVAWPLVLAVTTVIVVGYGLLQSLSLLPLSRYWNWMNGRLPKVEKDIQA